MSAKVVVLSSMQPGAGKTHFAAGLACWLRQHGAHAAPLHLSAREGDPVPCPEGGMVSRGAALLAESCGLAPEPVFEGGWQALPELRQRFDVVLVEAEEPVPSGLACVRVARREGSLHPGDLPGLVEFPHELMPAVTPELAALQPWTLTTAPRCGVITLPHYTNFADFQLLRGAEWLTTPAAGRFAHLFLPTTSSIDFDRAWLDEMGLTTWIENQLASGARLTACGWDYPGASRVEPGDLLNYRILSPILERRVPPPLPDEHTHDELAAWIDGWPGLTEFRTRYF